MKEIELKLPRSYIDCDIMKLTLKGNYDEIERNVRTQINDLPFLNMYFNIIFLKLTLLHFNEILHNSVELRIVTFFTFVCINCTFFWRRICENKFNFL